MYTANTSDIAILKRAHQKMVAEVAKVWEDGWRICPMPIRTSC